MKNQFKIIGGVALIVIIAFAGLYAYGQGPDIGLADALNETEDLSSLSQAMASAGILDGLDPDIEYTILAPTNAAFSNFNYDLYGELDDASELLSSLLRYHVVEGKLSVADISKMDTIETLEGEVFSISTSGSVMVNNVPITNESEIECSDGYVIPVGSILLPPTITETYIDLTITDAAGRDVYIRKVPDRIVTLASSATETLFAIDAGDLVVGRDKYSTYPIEVEDIPNLGSGSSLALEETLNLDPDLVITWYYSTTAIESLEQNGINVLAIGPSSVQDVLDQIFLFGEICGKSDNAQSLVNDMESSINEIQSFMSTVPEEDKVKAYYELSTAFKSVNNATFTGQLMEMAGGINIAGGLDEKYPKLSSEWIIDQNPDMVVVVSYGSTLEEINSRDGWDSIDAVINGNVYSIESNWVSATPRLVLGLEQFAKWFYPEQFS